MWCTGCHMRPFGHKLQAISEEPVVPQPGRQPASQPLSRAHRELTVAYEVDFRISKLRTMSAKCCAK
eukprot:6926397-Heterocapsa_arctica.AAC.1